MTIASLGQQTLASPRLSYSTSVFERPSQLGVLKLLNVFHPHEVTVLTVRNFRVTLDLVFVFLILVFLIGSC